MIGDCVGGILGFDALCSSSVTVSESQNSSRRGSAISVQVSDRSAIDEIAGVGLADKTRRTIDNNI